MAPTELTPREIVEELDRHIVGQTEAKRAVAIALRNRYRRRQVPLELRDEVTPKNILMIGPTGVGKTEIARRLARLANAPLIKVEATKFTEVGYVGRDVESIIRDLVESAVRMVKAERIEIVKDKVGDRVENRLLEALVPIPEQRKNLNPFGAWFGGNPPPEDDEPPEHVSRLKQRREAMREPLRRGELDEREVEIEIEDQAPAMMEMFPGAGGEEMGANLQDLFSNMLPRRRRRRRVSVAEARQMLRNDEAQKLVDMDAVTSEAVGRVEQSGIVFLDEIDKIAGREHGGGPDVSREGVQRDILPIVEGSTVMTKYGPVKTDHILFIAAGAFSVAKPSDLIPELQGRFPIRVELSSLSRFDFERILTEPEHALTRQYVALLATEGVDVAFTPEAITRLAELAALVNERTEDIGARRLHTILERLLEELLFEAPDLGRGEDRVTVRIDPGYVDRRLAGIVRDQDMSRYIL